MIRRFLALGIVMFLIIFAVSDNQGLAIESDEKIKIEQDEELTEEIEVRPIELLDPILDATIKPIELLEPRLSEETKSPLYNQ